MGIRSEAFRSFAKSLAIAAKSQDTAVLSDATEAEELKPRYNTSLILRDFYFN